MRRLAGLKEAVAAGFTAVTTYIDGERVRIGDPDWVKMTDDIEGTVEELKNKYRGAKVTVKSTGEQEVSIEVERKKGSRLSERAAGGSPSRNTEGEFKVGDKVVYFDGKDQIEGTIVGVRSSGGYYVKDRYRTTFSADERDLIPTAKFKGEERLSERAAGGSRGWESVSGVPTPVKVYDNGGETADRYTVVLDEPGTRRGGDFTALGLSDNPGHPQGFSQFTTAQDGPHLGKRIKFSDLPDGVRKHAAARLKPEEESLSERAAAARGAALYVDNSSWFDAHPYDIEKISAALQQAGAKDIHTSKQFGWSNQPEVVVFRGIGEKEAENAVGKALGTDWILVRKKSWKDGRGSTKREESRSGRRLAGLNERATEHWAVIAYDDNETKMDILRRELEKNDIEAEIEPIQQPRGGERYDLLVPKSKEAEANKILTAFHGLGLSRNRSYKLPRVPEDAALGERAASARWGGEPDPTNLEVGTRVSSGGAKGVIVKGVQGAWGGHGDTHDEVRVEFDDGKSAWVRVSHLDPEESRSGRGLAGMREDVAAGFTAVTLYIDGERVQIGDPDWVKMTDDVEDTVENLKRKYRGAKVTVTPAGKQEVMIEIERKGRGESLGERAASTGEDLTHDIWREIGRWLEDEEEFELEAINRPISKGSRLEKDILALNIDFIVRRRLENKLGRMTAKDVTVEIEPSGFESSAEEDEYRAVGRFRIWHDQDSAAEGSFAANGMAGELQDITINITQASGHGKQNRPLQFFG